MSATTEYRTFDFSRSGINERAFRIFRDLLQFQINEGYVRELIFAYPDGADGPIEELIAMRAYSIADAFTKVEARRSGES